MGSAIEENYRKIRDSLPKHVEIVVAAKSRTPDEVEAVIRGGAKIIGHNYVQEAEEVIRALPPEVKKGVAFHMLGHLQRNKARKALGLFDTIQTVDSRRLAMALDKKLEAAGKKPVLIQVNIGGEKSKHGIEPDELNDFLEYASTLRHLDVTGLMTIEPFHKDPEHARPYFRKMHRLFMKAAEMPHENIRMEVLSMGMSSSYQLAAEEGANMVRIGTEIFGPRP